MLVKEQEKIRLPTKYEDCFYTVTLVLPMVQRAEVGVTYE